MPIDPNIALGVRPVEIPNMLGQMGQMMQLRQAQQQYEQQNNLRDAFAQGTDINDPATFDRIARQDPKLALDLRGKHFEQQQKQTEVGLKRTEYLGAAYGGLVKNPTIENAYSIFDNAVAMGILPKQVADGLRAKIAATGGDPKQIAALAQQGVDGAIDAKAKLQAQVTREGHGVTMYGHNVTKQNNEYNQQNPTQHFFTGEDGTLMVAPQRGGGAATPVPMGGSSAPPSQITMGGGGGAAPVGAGSSIMTNPAPVNALAPSAPINQNALITQAQPTLAPAAPTYAKVRATPVTKDIVDPTDATGRRMITVEVNTYKAGTGLGVDGTQAAPAGVLGVATSQIPPNYLRDPNNPQGVIPVPGSPADPNAAVPSGYRRTAKGFEAIPGGPADPAVQGQQVTSKLDAKTIATRDAAYPQATLAVKSGEQNTIQLIKEVNALHDSKGLSGITGLVAGRTPNFSGDARSAQADLKKIIAEGTLKVLTDLRAASKTGGALGNTSNKDIDLLQNAAAALDQTQNTEDFKRKLKDFAFVLDRTKQNMREAYDMTYEYKTQATSGFTYLGKE